MTVNDPEHPNSGDNAHQPHGVARKNRGVRFSDHEWEQVQEAAQDHGVTPAEFVRTRILDLVRTPDARAPSAVAVHLVPLIERTFRYTYMLATRMRDEMTAAGHEAQLGELIEEARKLQDELLDARPD